MPEIIIAIGCPASGKSTYYKNNYEKRNYIQISADAIRKKTLGSEDDQSRGSLIFKIFYENLSLQLQMNSNIYIDNTNINRKSRKDILKFAKKHNNYFIKGIVFKVPFYKLLWRDLFRKKRVGFKVIRHFYKKFENPITQEGFHSITYI